MKNCAPVAPASCNTHKATVVTYGFRLSEAWFKHILFLIEQEKGSNRAKNAMFSPPKLRNVLDLSVVKCCFLFIKFHINPKDLRAINTSTASNVLFYIVKTTRVKILGACSEMMFYRLDEVAKVCKWKGFTY